MDRIDAYRTFLAVAELGSFSEAARRLGLSAGQVSKQVAALEQHLKLRLFERTTRAVRLTNEGTNLLSEVTSLVEQSDRIESGATHVPDCLTGVIRMTAPVIYGTNTIAPLMAEFLAKYPGLSVRLSLSDRHVDLVEEGFDLAVRVGEIGDISLIGKKLRTECTAFYASPSYLNAHGRPQSPDELSHHECVIDLNIASPRKWRAVQDSETREIRIDGRFETDSATAALAAAVAGMGIALVPSWCIDEQVNSGQLERVLPDWMGFAPEVWVLWPPGRFLPDRVRQLIDFLTGEID